MKVFILVFGLLLLMGCSEAPALPVPGKQSQGISSVSNDTPQSSDELTDSLILQKIYGRVHRQPIEYGVDHSGDMVGKVAADSTQFSRQNWESLGVLQGFAMEYFVENKWKINAEGQEKYLVVLSSSGESCHICPGVCAGAVFVKNGTEWQLETYENDIAVIGASGEPINAVEWSPCGKNANAIILEAGSIWQGTACDYFTVVVYADSKFSEALDEPVNYSFNNWNNCTEVNSYITCYGYTSTIYFKPDSNEIWDMTVHFQGTQFSENANGPILLNRKIRFKFQNGRYITKDKLPDA